MERNRIFGGELCSVVLIIMVSGLIINVLTDWDNNMGLRCNSGNCVLSCSNNTFGVTGCNTKVNITALSHAVLVINCDGPQTCTNGSLIINFDTAGATNANVTIVCGYNNCPGVNCGAQVLSGTASCGKKITTPSPSLSSSATTSISVSPSGSTTKSLTPSPSSTTVASNSISSLPSASKTSDVSSTPSTSKTSDATPSNSLSASTSMSVSPMVSPSYVFPLYCNSTDNNICYILNSINVTSPSFSFNYSSVSVNGNINLFNSTTTQLSSDQSFNATDNINFGGVLVLTLSNGSLTALQNGGLQVVISNFNTSSGNFTSIVVQNLDNSQACNPTTTTVYEEHSLIVLLDQGQCPSSGGDGVDKKLVIGVTVGVVGGCVCLFLLIALIVIGVLALLKFRSERVDGANPEL